MTTFRAELDPVQVGFFVRNLPRETERQLNQAVSELLKFIEEAQILAYTQDARPRKPAGSRYRRTFRLRRSSRTSQPGTKLPELRGKWEARIDYASDVLGPRNQQKAIHRGRWKSLEDVQSEAEEVWPNIAEERLKEVDEKLRRIRN